MSQIRWDEAQKLILAPVSLKDLVQSRAHTHDLALVLEKIRLSFSLATTFALFFQENPVSARLLLRCHARDTLERLHQSLPGSDIQGDLLVLTFPAASLDQAERTIRTLLEPLLTTQAS